MLNIAQVAEKLQVSEGLVRKWIGSGELTHYRLGNRIRISEDELNMFLAGRRKGPRIAQLATPSGFLDYFAEVMAELQK
jgi:excisionase family DNA binding protein